MKVECCLWEVRVEGHQPIKEPGKRKEGISGNEHDTCKRAWLFQWEGSVITWRGGNGRDVRRRFKREGTHVHPRFIPVDVGQKSNQYCKAIINQLKINKLKKNQLHFGDRATYLRVWCELLQTVVDLLGEGWLFLLLYFAGWCSTHKAGWQPLCLSCQRAWQLRWRLSDTVRVTAVSAFLLVGLFHGLAEPWTARPWVCSPAALTTDHTSKDNHLQPPSAWNKKREFWTHLGSAVFPG